VVVGGHGGREDVELQRLCDFGHFFRNVGDVAGRELAGGDEGGKGVLLVISSLRPAWSCWLIAVVASASLRFSSEVWMACVCVG